MPLSWGDLVAMQERRGNMLEETFRRVMDGMPKGIIKRSPPFYNQSGSPIVDEYFHRITEGQKYTKPSFEIKYIS
jgi:hypothetical protein